MKALLISMCLAACLLAQAESVLERADEAFRQGDLDRLIMVVGPIGGPPGARPGPGDGLRAQ